MFRLTHPGTRILALVLNVGNVAQLVHQLIVLRVKPRFVSVSKFIGRMVPANWAPDSLGPDSWAPEKVIQLWFLELHDSPLELKGELQYLDENCHFRGEKMTILV